MKKIVLGLATSAIVTTLAMPASAQVYVGAEKGMCKYSDAVIVQTEVFLKFIEI